MNNEATKENLMTLQQILGMSESGARELITANIAVNSSGDVNARTTAHYVSELLSRTIRRNAAADSDVLLEVLINTDERKTQGTPVYVNILNSNLTVSLKPSEYSISTSSQKTHDALLLISACYTTGFALRQLITTDALPFPTEIRVDFRDLIGDLTFLEDSVNIGDTFLAGAGAIGNGFVSGLVTFPNLKGRLTIVDDDTVSQGNLNRCILFTEADVGKNKAISLAEYAQTRLPHLDVKAHKLQLSKVPERERGATWLQRLVVGVDSRRTRRSLQSEMPKEVFDASTTGISEFVLHHNMQPNTHACMSCIYAQELEELQHERHVADKLGISLEEMVAGYVNAETAAKIKRKYPTVNERALFGQAYDTLFKQLCAEGKLTLDGDTQVLAPLAFISTMAGVYLAIEFVRRVCGRALPSYNYWRVSPWTNPTLRLRQMRQKNPLCPLCANPISARVAKEIWK